MNTAREDLTAYIETVQESQIKAREIIRSQKKLTRRQGEILIELIENRNSEYPIFQIAEMFSTVYETARTDLRTLEMAGLVSKIQRGKTFYYYVNDENIRMIRKNNPTRDLFGFDE
jgi:Fic family protein